MYLNGIGQCGYQCPTNNSNGSNSRNNYTTNLFIGNWKRSFKWFTCHRNLDINQISWWNYHHWYWNKLYSIIAFSWDLYLYRNQCFRMYFGCLCKCGYNCVTVHPNCPNCRNNYSTNLLIGNWKRSFK